MGKLAGLTGVKGVTLAGVVIAAIALAGAWWGRKDQSDPGAPAPVAEQQERQPLPAQDGTEVGDERQEVAEPLPAPEVEPALNIEPATGGVAAPGSDPVPGLETAAKADRAPGAVDEPGTLPQPGAPPEPPVAGMPADPSRDAAPVAEDQAGAADMVGPDPEEDTRPAASAGPAESGRGDAPGEDAPTEQEVEDSADMVERELTEETRRVGETAVEQDRKPSAQAASEPSDEGGSGPAEETERTDTTPAPDATSRTAGEAVVGPPVPRLDLVRIEPGGSAMVAGRGAPGAEIMIELDGKEMTRLRAGGDGSFAGFVIVPPSEAARVLRLVQITGGSRQVSRDEAILAPVVVAAAKPGLDAVTEDATAPHSEPEVGALVPDMPVEPVEDEVARDLVARDDAGSDTGDDEGRPARVEISELPDARPEVVPRPEVQTAPTAQPESPDAEKAEPVSAPEPAPELVQRRTAVLMSGEDGIRVVQPPVSGEAAPGVMRVVAIDAITYSDAGEVEVTGRGRPAGNGNGGFVRLYLDNRAVTTSRIAMDGNWRTELPDVDSGVYTLRVDQIDDEGRVVSRVETPFKREAPDVLAGVRSDAMAESGRVAAVTVQPGDTLWAISRENYGEGILYVRLYKANRDRIRDPDLIYPGQVFDIPPE